MSEEMKELQTNEVTETMADYEDHFDDANHGTESRIIWIRKLFFLLKLKVLSTVA